MVTEYIISLDKALLGDILIQLCNTLILCFILFKLLYNPVLNFLNNRRERIENEISDAQQMLKSAEELKAQYEEKLKNIEKEKMVILENANKYATDRQNQIISEAKQEANVIKNRALDEIAKAGEKAKDDVKNQIIEVSSVMAGKFIAKNMTAEEGEKLFDETLKDLEETLWQN